MNTRELMIGDWVHVNPISNKVEPHDSRVLSIRREYTGQVYIEGGYKDGIPPDGEDKWYGWSVGIGDISPIRLTQEILEKNGYHTTPVYDIDDDSIVYQHIDLRGEWTWYNGKIYYSVTDEEVVEMFDCKYVHEFQHILRLWSIEKEIVL